MITLHEQGHTYHIWLRAAYTHIKSEEQFREMIERSIVRYETLPGYKEYAAALRTKSSLEVCSIFGIISKSILVK